MDRPKFGYIVLCVVAPVAWGLIVLWLSNRIEAAVRKHGRKRGMTESETTMTPLDYYI